MRLHAITRHVLGLFRAVPGARAFRRHLATEAVKPGAGAAVMADALALVLDSGQGFREHRRLIFACRPLTSSGETCCWVIRSARSCCSRCWIAGAGILVGILAGLFGIGGGAIIVPVLYEVFRVLDVPEDVRMQLCIGTSLAIIVPTTMRSYHRAQEEGRGDPARWCGSGRCRRSSASRSAPSSRTIAPAQLFKIVFVVFATLIALRMLFGTRTLEARQRTAGRAPGSLSMASSPGWSRRWWA